MERDYPAAERNHVTDRELDLIRAWEGLRHAEASIHKATTLLAELSAASDLDDLSRDNLKLAIKQAIEARKSCEEASHSVDNLIPRTSP
jgi:hypothetical protein